MTCKEGLAYERWCQNTEIILQSYHANYSAVEFLLFAQILNSEWYIFWRSIEIVEQCWMDVAKQDDQRQDAKRCKTDDGSSFL